MKTILNALFNWQEDVNFNIPLQRRVSCGRPCWDRKFDSAESFNSQINSALEIESSRQAVNTILIKYLQDSIPHIDSSDAAILKPIAYGDPIQFGEAVYTAIVLLGIDPESLIKSATDVVMPADKNILFIYPNPANSSVTLNLNSNLDLVVKIRIVDLYSLFRSEKFVSSNTSTEIDISNLPPGIYIVQASFNGEILGASTFSIQR